MARTPSGQARSCGVGRRKSRAETKWGGDLLSDLFRRAWSPLRGISRRQVNHTEEG